MSLSIQAIFTNRYLKPLSPPNPKTHFPNHRFMPPLLHQSHIFPITKISHASSDEPHGTSPSRLASIGFDFDSLLSALELASLASAAAISVYAALARNGGVWVWQCVVLASGALVGAVIRRRQWRRVCGANGGNLLVRVEKLEEDLRSSATIIRVLSRQIEKLGVRVRVNRKALKEPISETASLAQKNSEVTRALAAKEDLLEKELGEIQKVVLAMQEQQQKQLELILAIGKAGKLWENKLVPTKNHNTSETTKSSVEINEVETMALQSKQTMTEP